MNICDKICDNTLILTPSTNKKKLLQEISQSTNLFRVKIMTLEECKKKIYFDYDEDAVIELMRMDHIKSDIAKIYLKNMMVVKENTSSKKLKALYEKRKSLEEKGIVKKNDLFLSSLKEKSILITGYDFYKKEDIAFIDELKQITKVEVISKEETEKKVLTVYEFPTLEEEVEFILEKMISLFTKGIPWHKIKLAGLDDTYKKTFQELLAFFPLPIEVEDKVSLFETQIGKKILKRKQEQKSFFAILNEFQEQQIKEDIYEQILDIFNHLDEKIEPEILLTLLEDKLKETKIKGVTLSESIEIISLENLTLENDDHVFVIGFTNGRFPIIKKDEDFLSNQLKKELNMSTTEEENRLRKKALMNTLYQISNLTITYAKNDDFNEYYPSTLIEDDQMNVEIPSESIKHHAKTWDKIRLAGMLDDYIKYGIKSEKLNDYYVTHNINYRTYNHAYQKINPEILKDFLDHKLLLSYSSLDNFYRCSFRYFLQNILKIAKFEETQTLKLGNIFHGVLAKMYDEDFLFNQAYQEELEKYELSKKESFYLNKLKKDLEKVIEVIQKQEKLTGFSKHYLEEKFYVPIDNTDTNTTFMGVIDKIYEYNKNGQALVSIVDYKTGSANIDLSYVPYGLKMQLPAYMYLLKKSNRFSHHTICGIYLQKLLFSGKPEEKEKNLRLQGYTTSREDLLELWDVTYENSEMIQSLKKTKNGWYKYAKLLSEDEVEQLIQEVEEKVRDAATKILNADFPINPKRIDGENKGCEFCQFQDICFHQEKDFVNIERGEDNHAEMDERATTSN